LEICTLDYKLRKKLLSTELDFGEDLQGLQTIKSKKLNQRKNAGNTILERLGQ